MDERRCGGCEVVKPISDFYVYKGRVNGTCRQCQSARRKARYLTDPEHQSKVKAYSAAHYAANKERARANQKAWIERNRESQQWRIRERFLVRKYGITQAEFDEMLAQQGGVCFVCHGPQRHGKANLCVDHCHETGKVRGLLCDYCNRAAGSLENDPVRAERMATYLRR